MTFTYSDGNPGKEKEKNQTVDWSVQIQVRSYRSHVTGFNFAQHTHVVPIGIKRKHSLYIKDVSLAEFLCFVV